MAKKRIFAFVCLLFLLALPFAFAQKKQERAKLHSDFYFGSYPTSRDAAELMAKENVRLLLVGFHLGWDVDKVAKETKLSAEDLNKLYDDLDDQHLAGKRSADDDARPFMPVIRERDYDRLKDSFRRYTDDFSKVLQANWADIETATSSLTGAAGVPKQQLLYQVVVSGILMGGMHDAFYDDKTMMSPPPRRGKGQRFYGWLVESDPTMAGTIKREARESDEYSIVTIGPVLPEARVSLDQIRGAHGMILEQQEARRFRSFIALLCRDKLLPFFKRNRPDLLKVAGLAESGRYVSFEDFFAWYYDVMVNTIASELASAGRIKPPTDQYSYAFKLSQ
jgi:hypothetical protein